MNAFFAPPTRLPAWVSRTLQLGAVVGGLLCALPSAQAARVLAVAQPMRCFGQGVCFNSFQDGTLTGAYREGDQEMHFEALFLPWTPPASEPAPWAYIPWCVRLTEPNGEVYSTLYGNPECLARWFPNYRDPITQQELDDQATRTRTQGPIVFGAQTAAQATTPPAGAEQAWSQVVRVIDEYADTVHFETGL